MDHIAFATILSDKHFFQLNRLRCKYPELVMSELLAFLLKSGLYRELPLLDRKGMPMLLYPAAVPGTEAMKILLQAQPTQEPFGRLAMTEEIASTLTIEELDFKRESIRDILNGSAPRDEEEERIYGLKLGLDFISDPSHEITEENLVELYRRAIGQFLHGEDRLSAGAKYRNAPVFVVGQKVEHMGMAHVLLSDHMQRLIAFIQEKSEIDDLQKAAIVHFQLAWLHPWFDGNGRMARLLQLWFLVRQGFRAALFIPLSKYVSASRKKYDQAFTDVEKNEELLGRLDVTPFMRYFQEEVYRKLKPELPGREPFEAYRKAFEEGQVTEKESLLWGFILSHYGTNEFSTKQLEKDYRDVAYATVRAFVMKFERLGLLRLQRYGARAKYAVIS